MRKEVPPGTKGSAEAGSPEGRAAGSRLRRWSRRKAAARSAPEPAADDAPAPPGAAPSTSPAAAPPGPGDGARSPGAAGLPDRAPLTDADMPPLESLGADSDYSGFLSPEVSEELRRAALRKLFLSPVFNVVDGLDDYDEDFTSFEALGDVMTADRRLRLEREAEAREAAGASAEPGPEPGPEPGAGPGAAAHDPEGAEEGAPAALAEEVPGEDAVPGDRARSPEQAQGPAAGVAAGEGPARPDPPAPPRRGEDV